MVKGVEHQEAMELLVKYIDQCHAEADVEANTDPESSRVSNRANIKADIKIASLYSKTDKYKQQALDSLDEALLASSQDDSTKDLVEEIARLIESIEA